MKNLILKGFWGVFKLKYVEYVLLIVIAGLVWISAPRIFQLPLGNSEEVATSIGLMLLLALIGFLLAVGLVVWLVQRFCILLGLPAVEELVYDFKSLRLWEQLGFYFGLFAVLLLAAVGVIVGVM